MQVRVLMFASHRELFGRGRVELDLPEGTTLDQLYEMLSVERPALSQLRPYTTFAVNREVVGPEQALRPGDEVALLQPVSGGAGD